MASGVNLWRLSWSMVSNSGGRMSGIRHLFGRLNDAGNAGGGALARQTQKVRRKILANAL